MLKKLQFVILCLAAMISQATYCGIPIWNYVLPAGSVVIGSYLSAKLYDARIEKKRSTIRVRIDDLEKRQKKTSERLSRLEDFCYPESDDTQESKFSSIE